MRSVVRDIIIAFLGAFLALIGAILIEEWKECRERRALSVALCTDISSVLSEMQNRRSEFSAVIEHMKSGDDISKMQVFHDKVFATLALGDPTSFADRSLQRLSVLDPATLNAVHSFYSTAYAERHQFNSLLAAVLFQTNNVKSVDVAKRYDALVIQASSLGAASRQQLNCSRQ